MKKLTKIIIKKISLILLFYFFLHNSILKAEIFNEIIITGNKRLSFETILMFSGLKKKIDLDRKDLNSAIKKLYETDYFKDIEILIINDKLEIKVQENPIIQTISIKGIKNKSIVKQLEEITKKSEKYPFLKSKVKDEKNILLNLVRSAGFYFSDIEAKVVDNKNNSVNLIYNFNLGDLAVIKNINEIENMVNKVKKYLYNYLKLNEKTYKNNN